MAIAVVLVASLWLPPSAIAHTTLRWGYSQQLTSELVDGACVSTANVWLQELGLSGVTRLRAKFERRGPYDPGIAGLSYETLGWYRSIPFRDDGLNYYAQFSAAFRYVPGGLYKIHTVFIGERPGFWRPDRKLTADLGEIGCSDLIDMGS